jgi:hypothetical protein
MLKLTNTQVLENTTLPPTVALVARHELETLLLLSNAYTVDEEFGYVLVVEQSDSPEVVARLLKHPVEGVVKRQDCFVLYLSGRGGNEHLPSVVLPENLLAEEHRQKLLLELPEGDRP